MTVAPEGRDHTIPDNPLPEEVGQALTNVRACVLEADAAADEGIYPEHPEVWVQVHFDPLAQITDIIATHWEKLPEPEHTAGKPDVAVAVSCTQCVRYVCGVYLMMDLSQHSVVLSFYIFALGRMKHCLERLNTALGVILARELAAVSAEMGRKLHG